MARPRRALSLGAAAAFGVVAACTAGAPPAPPPDPPSTASAPPSAAPASSPAAVPSASSAPAAGPCAGDADCGWDDACVPARCVRGGAARGSSTCDESAPAPGACACVAGSCALRPSKPPPATERCAWGACEVDAPAGRCVLDTKTPEQARVTPPVAWGPSCDCVSPASGCTFTWFERVPCKSVDDCWVDPSPRRHPVRRPAGKRGPFRPCKDGTAGPACVDGFCAVGPAYKC